MRVGGGHRVIVRDTTARGSFLLPSGEAVAACWDAGAERLFDAAGSPLPGHQPATHKPATPDRMTSDA